MGRDLSLPNERAAVGIDVFERTFQRDDISRARHVDLFYERGKRRRLSRARRSGNDDQTGGRVDELAEIRVQIAAVQILDGRCEQPYGGGHSAHGSIEIDPAAYAADGYGHVGGNAFAGRRPPVQGEGCTLPDASPWRPATTPVRSIRQLSLPCISDRLNTNIPWSS